MLQHIIINEALLRYRVVFFRHKGMCLFGTDRSNNPIFSFIYLFSEKAKISLSISVKINNHRMISFAYLSALHCRQPFLSFLIIFNKNVLVTILSEPEQELHHVQKMHRIYAGIQTPKQNNLIHFFGPSREVLLSVL